MISKLGKGYLVTHTFDILNSNLSSGIYGKPVLVYCHNINAASIALNVVNHGDNLQ